MLNHLSKFMQIEAIIHADFRVVILIRGYLDANEIFLEVWFWGVLGFGEFMKVWIWIFICILCDTFLI